MQWYFLYYLLITSVPFQLNIIALTSFFLIFYSLKFLSSFSEITNRFTDCNVFFNWKIVGNEIF